MAHDSADRAGWEAAGDGPIHGLTSPNLIGPTLLSRKGLFIACAELRTRSQVGAPPQECCIIHYGDVRVGTISERVGNPTARLRKWACRLYPGRHPRECTHGTAASFEKALQPSRRHGRSFSLTALRPTSRNTGIIMPLIGGSTPCGMPLSSFRRRERRAGRPASVTRRDCRCGAPHAGGAHGADRRLKDSGRASDTCGPAPQPTDIRRSSPERQAQPGLPCCNTACLFPEIVDPSMSVKFLLFML